MPAGLTLHLMVEGCWGHNRSTGPSSARDSSTVRGKRYKHPQPDGDRMNPGREDRGFDLVSLLAQSSDALLDDAH